MRPWEKTAPMLLMGGLGLIAACATQGATTTSQAPQASEPPVTDTTGLSPKNRSASSESADLGPNYAVPKHPLMATRSMAPRTSLSVYAENTIDIALQISNEASVVIKRHTSSGEVAGDSVRLADALRFGKPKVSQVAQLKDGATLHRVDMNITIDEPMSLQSMISFLRRIERNDYLTASSLSVKTTKRWWGVCRGKSKITVSSWFARGRPSLPEIEMHLPKVSATRILYSLVQSMRAGELHKANIGAMGFQLSGKTRDGQALSDYVSSVEDAHSCIKRVDSEHRPNDDQSGLPFSVQGSMRCRTR